MLGADETTANFTGWERQEITALIMIAVGGSFSREKLNDIVTLTRARDVKAKEKSVHT